MARELGENNAILEPPQGASKISIEVLEAQRSGIYVCVNSQTTNKSAERFQRVFLLKLKSGNGLLRGRETRKEFDACPVIGGGDQDSSGSSYWGSKYIGLIHILKEDLNCIEYCELLYCFC